MRKVNNILKFVGAIITAFCLTIFIISVIGFFNSTDKQQTMYFVYSLSFAGLGLISMLSTLDEL
jgi:hypothetical protein